MSHSATKSGRSAHAAVYIYVYWATETGYYIETAEKLPFSIASLLTVPSLISTSATVYACGEDRTSLGVSHDKE